MPRTKDLHDNGFYGMNFQDPLTSLEEILESFLRNDTCGTATNDTFGAADSGEGPAAWLNDGLF